MTLSHLRTQSTKRMRFFLNDLEKTYNSTNPFGYFPLWEYYPKTGTHIGTDFRVPIGTPVIAPQDGEMFKVEISAPKGNVGIYIFEHNSTTWGLELCHLRELPQKRQYKEGEVIAYSGNTGSAVAGAHLHAVLHRNATVTKNYQALQSREDFLRLQKEGAIVDCWEWFRANVSSATPVEFEYHTEIRPAGAPLTKEDIARKFNEGWEEYFPIPEERIVFQPTANIVLSGVSSGYIFRRKKHV
ncbi:MAG: hypothetical protein UY67_C0032G0003 [Candidatus Kaiserbacteria bacterium GW2011_GWA2_52_12]|uniref:M23ase beta-sheet core domain-containing protein n=1 Tax=Candidatus Kaiserbacteria bacterium GW2011_GWA2_52_12 TaxID=1618671 RepID=A0A0G1WVZ9_9BACT|nr:MAG: hypothetical protein UY67_C0032G0003 [Candidatus Kaiserbacteria bacterium GW2011_GWA2_52_12]